MAKGISRRPRRFGAVAPLPASSALVTHAFRLRAVQPIFSAIDTIAAQREG